MLQIVADTAEGESEREGLGDNPLGSRTSIKSSGDFYLWHFVFGQIKK